MDYLIFASLSYLHLCGLDRVILVYKMADIHLSSRQVQELKILYDIKKLLTSMELLGTEEQVLASDDLYPSQMDSQLEQHSKYDKYKSRTKRMQPTFHYGTSSNLHPFLGNRRNFRDRSSASPSNHSKCISFFCPIIVSVAFLCPIIVSVALLCPIIISVALPCPIIVSVALLHQIIVSVALLHQIIVSVALLCPIIVSVTLLGPIIVSVTFSVQS